MDETLVRRVKAMLNNQHYIMNDSWLSDCIEYYLNDHPNAQQKEIATFVMTQWVLYDLREINNEKGCLPKELGKQKCTTLTGKYILQMDKIYDISQSKYKQLEKIRKVSSENVEATEHENAEDKFQNFEPKSKRMLQLFLTDGIQNVLAIEFKSIRFLKDSLIPGLKVMIKGPVICRKGVILLEENNFAEIGGEVDSLLITNAIENIFARALHLEENPDPYNDRQTQTTLSQSTQNTIRSNQIDEDFDIDSQVLEQIDMQVQQQSSISNTDVVKSHTRNPSSQVSGSTLNIVQTQNSFSNNKTQSSIPSKQSSLGISKNKNKISQQKESNSKDRIINFEDDGDLFFDMVDEKEFQNIPTSKPTFKVPQLPTPLFKKPPPLHNVVLTSNIDDFPTDDEIYDLTGDSHSSSIRPKPQKNTSSVLSKASSKLSTTSNKNASNMNYSNTTLKNIFNQTPSESQMIENTLQKKGSVSNKFSIPDDDFDLNDVNMEEDFTDNFNKNKSNSVKTSHLSVDSSEVKNLTMKTEYSAYDGKRMNSNKQQMKVAATKSNLVKSEMQIKSNPSEQLKIKRAGDKIHISEEVPQKVRCLQNTPKSNKSNERKITNFFKSPTMINPIETKKSPLLKEGDLRYCELLKNALKQRLTDDSTRIIIRGRVIKIVKLNLMKNEKGHYFHLDGTVTDNTANLDVIFSSEMLEKVIGYSAQQFALKRKQSKIEPSIKDQLRNDLKEAQHTLTSMDELMEIELKKNSKAVIISSLKLTEKEKKDMDERVKKFLDT